MSTVSVSFEPLKRYAQIYIDGEHISPYSDLASCENKDLHVCGVRLLKLLDDEIGSEYRLNVSGSQFQIDLMTALAKQSEFCTAVKGTLSKTVFGEAETAEFAVSLNNRYSLGIDQADRVVIDGDIAERVQSDSAAVGAGIPEVYVVSQVPETIDRGKTVLLVSDHFDIRNTRGINIVEVPDAYVTPFIEYYRYYTKTIPFIEAVFSQSRYASLSKSDLFLLDAYVSQSPKYVFEIAKTDLDVGEMTDFRFEVFPPSASDKFQLLIDRPDAVRISGNGLVPVREGTVTLTVLDQTGKVCESKQLFAVKHNYVNSIRLVPSSSALEVGKKGRIDAYVLPDDAEDARSLKWSSSNPDVLHVTSAGELVALKPGKVVISVSATECRQQISVAVLPSLEKITLSKSTLTVTVGGSETIECHLYPTDAAHDELIWELSNDGMGTLNVSNDGKTCTFTAVTSSLTKGNIKCRVKGTEKSSSCSIQIVPEERPTGLMTCSIVFSIIGLIGSFLIPLLWFGGAGIAGFFADVCLPVGIILCLIGKAKHKKEKTFKAMLRLDLIFTGLMFLLAITCCNPPK